ncbi:MAG: NACHT domain-containing protein [Prochloraceae cyanobacterium]|nr:NACHT domain-containing protein [Prochloraceae cyanobacterium]
MPDPTLLRLLTPIAGQIARGLLNKIQGQFNRDELEQAIKAGLTAAVEQENQLSIDQRIFFKSQSDGFQGVDRFLGDFFNQERVLEHLSKPFNDHEWISVSSLVAEFKHVVQNYQKVDPLKNRIEPWLKTFLNSYFQHTPAYYHFQDVKKKYFQKLIKRYGKVRFGGITLRGMQFDNPEELLKIFVVPDVKAQTSDPTESISANELLNLSQSKRMVLLGAPGSGKTSLINYFAVKLASKEAGELGIVSDTDWLPIVIKIPDLATRWSNISIFEYLRELAKKRMEITNFPQGFFEYWIDCGRGIILLDSLDEIPEESNRFQVAEKIESFLEKNLQNRAIITCRPAGYRAYFLEAQDYPIYKLQPFDKPKINLFIELWYQQRFSDPQESQIRQNKLKELLYANPRIQLLAQNPLLLMIIALVHRYANIKLPERRSKLYENAVTTLLNSWQYEKDITNDPENKKPPQFKHINLEDIERLMETIAYWIHSEKNIDNEKNNSTIDGEVLINKLIGEIKELKKIEYYQAKKEAEEFLQYIRDRTGLLNKQESNIYGFVHPTFQEYLCAKEISYQQSDDGFKVVEDKIETYLYNSHWQEVLLLLLGEQKTPNQAAKFLNAILKQSSDDNNWRYHQILFAGMCLSENPKNLLSATDDPSSNILQELVSLEVSTDPLVDTNTKSKVREIICSLKETAFQPEALKIIEQHSQKINPDRLQQYRETLAATENELPKD